MSVNIAVHNPFQVSKEYAACYHCYAHLEHSSSALNLLVGVLTDVWRNIYFFVLVAYNRAMITTPHDY